MSYGMCQLGNNDTEFFIRAQDKPEAFRALLKWEENWIDANMYYHATRNVSTLEELLGRWDWECDLDEDGNITYLYFTGDRAGLEYEWFNAIAPWVKPGSCLVMQGEDNYIWAYYFDGSSCTTHNGKIIFPTIDALKKGV